MCAKTQQAIGPHEELLAIVKRHKLIWYGHVSRSLGLAKIILQGTEKGVLRQHQSMDRHGVHQVQEGNGEQRKMEEIGFEVIRCINDPRS